MGGRVERGGGGMYIPNWQNFEAVVEVVKKVRNGGGSDG